MTADSAVSCHGRICREVWAGYIFPASVGSYYVSYIVGSFTFLSWCLGGKHISYRYLDNPPIVL